MRGDTHGDGMRSDESVPQRAAPAVAAPSPVEVDRDLRSPLRGGEPRSPWQQFTAMLFGNSSAANAVLADEEEEIGDFVIRATTSV